MKSELAALSAVAVVGALLAMLFSAVVGAPERRVEPVHIDVREAVLLPGSGVSLAGSDEQNAAAPRLESGGTWQARILPGVDRLPVWQQAVVFIGYPFAFALLVLVVGLVASALAIGLLVLVRHT